MPLDVPMKKESEVPLGKVMQRTGLVVNSAKKSLVDFPSSCCALGCANEERSEVPLGKV